MRRFFIYEEYSAHMEEMKSDLQYAEGISPLKDYERGTEALSTPLLSLKGRETISRKGLHVSDLLIKVRGLLGENQKRTDSSKPIQRITKYPLLFENLCKYTPVYDDPEAHAELEKALSRLRETSQEINKATDSPRTRRMIEASWILQDRFLFSNTVCCEHVFCRMANAYQVIPSSHADSAAGARHSMWSTSHYVRKREFRKRPIHDLRALQVFARSSKSLQRFLPSGRRAASCRWISGGS